jgi:capping protein beta
MDEQEGKEFLKCEYNKDGDSYRSPWTNQYFPAIVVEDGDEEPIYPSNVLRNMEVAANEIFGSK